MIEARGLVKRYGATAAVNDLDFTIRPGLVTGFLGPDGTGQTTTMRLILSLDYPSAAAGPSYLFSRHYRWGLRPECGPAA
jgi:ABC-2 type transport system ATP-binding protein